MSNINLLPWRASHQAQQTRRICWQLLLVCLLTVLAISATAHTIKRQVQIQQARYLQLLEASAALGNSLRHIEQMRAQDQELQTRLQLIAQLQPQRSQALQLLNRLPTWLPRGVRLDSVQLANRTLELKGQGHSYQQLSLLVQRIEQEPWLREPRLQAQALSSASLDSETPAPKQFSLQIKVLAAPLMATPVAALDLADTALPRSALPLDTFHAMPLDTPKPQLMVSSQEQP